ncbi:MAG: GNAT family N-acetyltransferase [Phenylobacterium sp.]
MSEILTPRLRLRRACEDDAEALFDIFSRPAAMRYWSTPPHEDIAQTREWLAGMIASPPEVSCDYIVERDGRVIGKAGFFRLPEIGYILHPDQWGRGLAHEALSAVIARVFEAFPIPAVEADVDPRNAASLKLLAKLGFVETRRASRTWLVGEEWCDSVYLSLAR